MHYAVILMKARKLPSKEELAEAFCKIYYREPTEIELSSIKLDMLNENAIILTEKV